MLLNTSMPLRTAALSFRIPTHTTATPLNIRFASSSTAAAAAATNNTAAAAAATKPATLDWDSFLRLRRSKRRYNLASSITTSFMGTTLGLSYLADREIDVTQTIMGMDPIVIFGIATLSCGAVGWLAGPAIGGGVFNLVNRRVKGQMAVREKEFLKKVQRNRVDPSSQSMSNPVPDYYGEKIGSVQGYRQWLRDQRAYKLKREKFL